MDTLAAIVRYEELHEKLQTVGQTHLLRFWDSLTGAQQRQLAEQIDEIDFAELRQLREQYRNPRAAAEESPWAALAERAESPPAVRLGGEGLPCSLDEARARGERLLREGQVGMILVAGGLGTRLGFDQPKGMFELGPVSKRPLFQILIDHLLAVGERYGKAIPLYVMTSPATDAATQKFFAEHGNFGLAKTQLHFFCQGTMWALDAAADRVLMQSPSSLFLGPDGHGGMLRALQKSGDLADMQRRGLTQIFYGQIDNPLLQVCDPLLLGCHVVTGSELTTQVVRKRQPLERVGNVVMIDGKVQVIEYSDLPESAARRTAADSSLALWAGNLAVHVFDVQFLARVAGQAGALPFHVARKKVQCLDNDSLSPEPQPTAALRFERFIFDLLPAAKQALVVEADPAEAFAPVKNADTEATDTATTARAAMIAKDRRMLEQAGVRVAPGMAVEINPRYALDSAELEAKLGPIGTIERPTYFPPSPAERRT